MTSNRDQAPVPPHTLSVNTLTTGKRHTYIAVPTGTSVELNLNANASDEKRKIHLANETDHTTQH